MNEAELCIRVQKNWIRIKHETQNIREKVMDRLLEDGAITVDGMKEVKSKGKEDQFDFLLYQIIESQKCRQLLHVLEIYGRRQLCVAIRKTELNPEDFNVPTPTVVQEVQQKSADSKLLFLNQELKTFHVEMDETVSNMNQHINQMGRKMEEMDFKMNKMVVKKKKKVGNKSTSSSQKNELQKAKEDNERIRKLIKVKSDEVVKLNAQLTAKAEEIKWLKQQLEEKQQLNQKLNELLRRSNEEKIAIQKRLLDSKKEQVDLSNQLIESETKTKEIRETLLVYKSDYEDDEDDELPSAYVRNDDHTENTSYDGPASGRKPKRVTFKPESPVKSQPHDDPAIQELQSELDSALEERDCVNRLLKLKNAELLKLTAYIRAKTNESKGLRDQAMGSRTPRYDITEQIQKNDVDIYHTKERIADHMKAIEDFTEKLKPISMKINEISEQLQKMQSNC